MPVASLGRLILLISLNLKLISRNSRTSLPKLLIPLVKLLKPSIKKFNSEEFFGGDSEETNELLRELISVVRKKNFSITKKEVGEASVDYIRSQTRLKGASVI